MKFEAYKISERNYQLHMIEGPQRRWLASFNRLSTLLDYYIFCHNLTGDFLIFTGKELDEKEQEYLDCEINEWKIDLL